MILCNPGSFLNFSSNSCLSHTDCARLEIICLFLAACPHNRANLEDKVVKTSKHKYHGVDSATDGKVPELPLTRGQPDIQGESNLL